MARTKKTPDYLNLPFEVHYDQMWSYGYELIHESGIRPRAPEDYIGVIYTTAKAYGATYRSENAHNGSLIFLLTYGTGDFQPDWLTFLGDDNLDVKSQEYKKFSIVNGEFVLGEDIDEDELGDYNYGDSFEFHCFEDAADDCLVLDADKSRVVVDQEGYRLAEDYTYMDESPILIFSEDDAQKLNFAKRYQKDINIEIANYFKELRKSNK
jgi:hypothetical protein